MKIRNLIKNNQFFPEQNLQNYLFSLIREIMTWKLDKCKKRIQ